METSGVTGTSELISEHKSLEIQVAPLTEVDVRLVDISHVEHKQQQLSFSLSTVDQSVAPALPNNIGVILMKFAVTYNWVQLDLTLSLLEIANKYAEKTDHIVKAVNEVDKETSHTLLMVCAINNQKSLLQRLVKLGADINSKTKDNNTVLEMAVISAELSVVQLLVELGASPTLQGGMLDQLPLHYACTRKLYAGPVVRFLVSVSGFDARLTQDKEGFIPFWRAAQSRNISAMRELLSEFPDEQLGYQNGLHYGDTVAHFLTRLGEIGMLKVMLASGISINATNFEGQTLFHLAALTGNLEIVQALYRKNALDNILDNLERSPVELAVIAGQTMIVDFFLQRMRYSLKSRQSDGMTLIHLAAQAGHVHVLRLLQRYGVSTNMPDRRGRLPVHLAAQNGHSSVITELLSTDPRSVNARTLENFTPLQLSVQYGHLDAVDTILGYEAAVDAKGGLNEETSLHMTASLSSDILCAQLLILSGADIHLKDFVGDTPLHRAATFGHVTLFKLLLKEGADVLARNSVRDTPLHHACENCHIDIIRMILNIVSRNGDAGAVINATNQRGESCMHYVAQITSKKVHFDQEEIQIARILLASGANMNISTTDQMETPYHYLAHHGNFLLLTAIVDFLGAEMIAEGIHKRSKNGYSPLLTASEKGHKQIVDILLQNSARTDVFDEEGKAALHLAAENGHLDIVDALLKFKAYVNAKTKAGITAMHLAAEKGEMEIIELLVGKYEAARDVISLRKKTPLHLAAQFGQEDICRRLLKLGADVKARDELKQTPLHLAASANHADILKLFLSHEEDGNLIGLTDKNGYNVVLAAADAGSTDVIQLLLNLNRNIVLKSKIKATESTVLHVAAAKGHIDLVTLLIQEGVSPTDENGEGLTTLHLAAREGHLDILALLKNRVPLNMCSIKTGLTALHISAFYGKMDFLKELLGSPTVTVKTLSEQPTVNNALVKETGAEPGLTALHLASRSGQDEIVRLLLNYSEVQVNVATRITGLIPLHLAAMNGHLGVVRLLIGLSELDRPDRKGRSPLIFAAAGGQLKVVEFLLDQDANIGLGDQNGWTTLHHASAMGQLDVVTLLVEHGAPTTAETKSGKIALSLAAASRHTDVLKYLMKRPHDAFELLEDNVFLRDLVVCGAFERQKPLQDFVIHSPSPVEVALKLSAALVATATQTQQKEHDLLDARAFCDTLAHDLLIVACKKYRSARILRAVDEKNQTMIDILVDGDHRQSVAIPAVQRYLTDIWHGFKKWKPFWGYFIYVAFLLCPPLWFFCSIPLGHKLSHIPFIKLACHVVSHLYFIIVLILVFLTPEVYNRLDGTPTPAEGLLLLWILGRFLDEVATLDSRRGSAWIRRIILILCGTAIVLHGFAFFSLSNEEPPLRPELLYLRNLMLSLACFFACIQIMSYLALHPVFGPMTVLIRDVLKSLLQFLFIVALFMAGFTFSLAALYLKITAPPDHDYHNTSSVMETAENLYHRFKELYSALLGTDKFKKPLRYAVPEYAPVYANTLVELLHMVNLMVLLKIFVASLSDMYKRLRATSDFEWKYGRAKLIMNMDKSAATPPPFNTVTVVWRVISLLLKGIRTRSVKVRPADFEDRHPGKSAHFRESGSFPGSARASMISWRKSLQHFPTGGSNEILRQLPSVRIRDCVDWELVAVSYHHHP